MNALIQLAAISIISLAAAGGTWWIKGPPTRRVQCDPATIKPDEICLQSIPAGGKILWVDARSRKDWEQTGVPGSVLWNLDPAEDMQAFEMEFVSRVVECPRVVVYCGDENCGISRQVAQRIRGLELGADVSVLRGGWRALQEAGRIKGSNPRP